MWRWIVSSVVACAIFGWIMSYIIDCLNDHVKGMKYREEKLKQEILVKSAELKLLEKERMELELGAENWEQESHDQ